MPTMIDGIVEGCHQHYFKVSYKNNLFCNVIIGYGSTPDGIHYPLTFCKLSKNCSYFVLKTKQLFKPNEGVMLKIEEIKKAFKF